MAGTGRASYCAKRASEQATHSANCHPERNPMRPRSGSRDRVEGSRGFRRDHAAREVLHVASWVGLVADGLKAIPSDHQQKTKLPSFPSVFASFPTCFSLDTTRAEE